MENREEERRGGCNRQVKENRNKRDEKEQEKVLPDLHGGLLSFLFCPSGLEKWSSSLKRRRLRGRTVLLRHPPSWLRAFRVQRLTQIPETTQSCRLGGSSGDAGMNDIKLALLGSQGAGKSGGSFLSRLFREFEIFYCCIHSACFTG